MNTVKISSDKRTVFLVRHGKPAFWNKHNPSELVNSSKLRNLISEYDDCTIDKIVTPGPDLLSLVKDSDILFTSDLLRSVDSGKLLNIPICKVNPTFREAQLPVSNLPGIRLPFTLWLSIQRIRWFLGNRKECESYSDFKARTRKSAEFIDSASHYKEITIVAHFFFNKHLTRYLADLKWQIDGEEDYRYWGVVKLQKD